MKNDEARVQVNQALQRLGMLVSRKDPSVLAEFAPDADVLLVGSERGEVVEGPGGLRDFFQRVFRAPANVGWEWKKVRISCSDDVAWLFAEGEVVVVADARPQRRPYRLTGVLQRHGKRWLWRHFHGSEPS
ncbi:MAG TPA: nuclear transport factor 2 family protein [Usitatibacter sp.]|nr:nuclear transport factor 2 family protein [Usitatibacter sp.]